MMFSRMVMCDQRLKLWNTMASLAADARKLARILGLQAAVTAGRQGDLLARDHDAAVVGGLEQIDAAQERALARAAGAQDGDHVALVRLHRDALEHLDLAELLLDALDRQGRRILLMSGSDVPSRRWASLRPLPLALSSPRNARARAAAKFRHHGAAGCTAIGQCGRAAPSTISQTPRRPARPRRSTSRRSTPDRLTPRPVDQLRRDERHAVQLLGQRLEPAGDVDRVADRRQGGGQPMAHLAQDHRAQMQTDANAQR